MAVLLDATAEAVGSIKSWIRASSSVPLPPTWLIADGSVVSDPDSPFNGQTLPDLRDIFEKGHPTLTNSTFGADTLYHIGGGGSIPNGGTLSHNLAHVHAAGPHTHSITGHTHTITTDGDHIHSVNSHAHNFTLPSHTHGIFSDSAPTDVAVYTGGGATFETASAIPSGHVHSGSPHSHGGSTASSPGTGGTTDNNSTTTGGVSATHSHGGATGPGSGSSAAGVGNTDSSLAVIDNEPPWLGLLRIVKVR